MLLAAARQHNLSLAIPIADYTKLIFLMMMSSKPARNMYRLTIEINKQKIVPLVASCYRDISRCTVSKTLNLNNICMSSADLCIC